MFKKNSEFIYIMLEFDEVNTNNSSNSNYIGGVIGGVNLLKELGKTLD